MKEQYKTAKELLSKLISILDNAYVNQYLIQRGQEVPAERANHHAIRDLFEALFISIEGGYTLVAGAHKIEERDVLQVGSIAIYLAAYHVKHRYLTNFLHHFLQLP